MKKHLLYKPIDIIKESEKAVCIKNIEFSEDMQLLINNGWNFKQCYANKKPFWMPKSQIDIVNNQIIAITKWMYNQLILYVDCPIILKEDVKDLEVKTATRLSKKINSCIEQNNKLKDLF